MEDILNHIPEYLSVYGPWGVFLLLLLPLGEDLIIIPAGLLIAQGHMTYWSTAVAAYVGSFISDGLWYVIGYRYGTPVLHKRWFKRLAHPRRLLQAKHQVEKRGAWVIVVSRFLPGSRTTVICTSGMMHMPFWKFALAEGVCLLITVNLQLGLGWLLGRHIIGSAQGAQVILQIAGLVVVLIVVSFAIGLITRHLASKKTAPRAKTTWLKRFRTPRIRTTLAAKSAARKAHEMSGSSNSR